MVGMKLSFDTDFKHFKHYKPIGLEEGLTREEFDEFLIEGLQEVAPSWPYPERLEDAIQSMR